MKGLGTAFKEVFGEALKKYGYIKVKGKYPYYIHVVNNEIVHVITFSTRPKERDGYKEYAVYGGVATVYRHCINFNIPVTQNYNWIYSNGEFYSKAHPYEDNREIRRKWYTFSYRENDEESLLESLRYALEVTEEVMLPILESADTMEHCYDYYENYDMPALSLSDDERWGIKYTCDEYGEGLLNLIMFNTDQYEMRKKQKFVEVDNKMRKQMELGLLNYSKEFYEKHDKDAYKSMLKRLELFSSFRDNVEIYEDVLREAERRKTHNIDMLRSYGVEI